MTIKLETLNELTQEEAALMLNSIMRDFTKVRIQADDDNAYAKSILLMDGELIDNIIDVIIEKMKGEISDEEKVRLLSAKAKDAQLKTYYALGYDDSHIEETLKNNVTDIKKLNAEFITFIRDKTNVNTKKNITLKKEFIDSRNADKKRLSNILSSGKLTKKHKLKLKQQMVTNQVLNDKLDKLNDAHEGKSSFLGDIFAVVTMATIASKVVTHFRKPK